VDGTVGAFDESEGFGTLHDGDGREFFFHCTQIVDGSRRIDVGTEVTFEVVAGHRGRYEAVAVARRLPSS
jgi:cold shock CspA family protein